MPCQRSIKVNMLAGSFWEPYFHSLFDTTLLCKRVRSSVIRIMDGIRKRSLPNTIRHASVLKIPTSAGRWFFDVIHCSVNAAINRAVMENSDAWRSP
jgi:hypothetical protein